MKKLDVSSVTDSAQLKIKKGTLQFLQDANYEAFASVVKAAIGPAYDPTKVYILHGVINSGSGNSYNISAGAVFYNGEIYQVDAVTFSTPGSQVAVFEIVTTQYTSNADPVTFTDASVHNVHNIRKIRIYSATSGSTIANFSDKSDFSFFVPAQVNITPKGALKMTGEYPNITLEVPATNNRNPALYSSSYHVGDIAPGDTINVTISFPTVGTSEYFVMGCIVSGAANVSYDVCQWNVRNRTATGFDLHMRQGGAWINDITFDFILFAK